MIVILCLTAIVYAAIPRIISYQGRLADKDSNFLTGNFLVTFRFYDAEKEGQPIWEKSHILNIKNGMFNVLMGSARPLEIDFNKDLWLGIEVADNGETASRIKLAKPAYALNAKPVGLNKIILADIQGRVYYLWVDTLSNLRLKQGEPSFDTDSSLVIKEKSVRLSVNFIQNITLLLLFSAVFILALILYSSKKKA